jgi:hypothetical protein
LAWRRDGAGHRDDIPVARVLRPYGPSAWHRDGAGHRDDIPVARVLRPYGGTIHFLFPLAGRYIND